MTYMSVALRSSTLGAALAALLAIPFLLATTPASADDGRRRGHNRQQHYRPHHGFYGFYGAPAPPYVVVRPPPFYAYPPPYVAYARPRLQCREWNGPAWINGRHEMVFGTVCLMPGGDWRLMD